MSELIKRKKNMKKVLEGVVVSDKTVIRQIKQPL